MVEPFYFQHIQQQLLLKYDHLIFQPCKPTVKVLLHLPFLLVLDCQP